MYFYYIVYGAISHDFILMVTQLTHTPYIWNTPYIHTTHTPNIHHTYTHMHHTHTHIPLSCTHNTTHHTHIITYICTTCTHHIHTLPHTHKYMQNQNLTHTTTSIYTRFCEEGKASKMKRDRSGKKSRRVTKHKLPVTTWGSASELSTMKCSRSFSLVSVKFAIWMEISVVIFLVPVMIFGYLGYQNLP